MAGFAEFLAACIAMVNLPFTILIVVMLLYWTTVILGGLDIDTLDVDFDADLDGLDGDADLESDTSGGNWFFSVLKFFNVGEVPLMVILSFMVVFMWMISMTSNYLLGNTSFVFAVVLMVPNFFVSAFITKFASMPVRALFKGLGKDFEVHEDLIGQTCAILTSKADKTFGQAEVKRHGSPLTLNVRTRGEDIIPQGGEAIILEEDKNNSVYIVKSLEL